MREQEAPCLNAKKVGVLTGPDQLRLSLINYLYLIRCSVSARHGVKQTRLLVCSSGLYKGLKLMLRAKESAALIAQVLPYGNTSSSTGYPRLLAGIHTKGRFCELHRRSSSLVRLVIVLFITFGLPPMPILIHRPYFFSTSSSPWLSVISQPVSESNFKAVFFFFFFCRTPEAIKMEEVEECVFQCLHLFYEEKKKAPIHFQIAFLDKQEKKHNTKTVDGLATINLMITNLTLIRLHI